jgi:hypothetical protein
MEKKEGGFEPVEVAHQVKHHVGGDVLRIVGRSKATVLIAAHRPQDVRVVGGVDPCPGVLVCLIVNGNQELLEVNARACVWEHCGTLMAGSWTRMGRGRSIIVQDGQLARKKRAMMSSGSQAAALKPGAAR